MHTPCSVVNTCGMALTTCLPALLSHYSIAINCAHILFVKRNVYWLRKFYLPIFSTVSIDWFSVNNLGKKTELFAYGSRNCLSFRDNRPINWIKYYISIWIRKMKTNRIIASIWNGRNREKSRISCLYVFFRAHIMPSIKKKQRFKIQ